MRKGRTRRTVKKVGFELVAAILAGWVSMRIGAFLAKTVFPNPRLGLDSLLVFPAPVLPALETAPVADYYSEQGILRKFDGSRSPSEVHDHIRASLATLRLEEEL